MTKYICVTCGKGGVGKTTTAVNLASAMHKHGGDVLLVEANTSTPNVHVHLGQKDIGRCLHDAIQQKMHPSEVVYTHGSGLRLIPALTDIEHLKHPDHAGFKDTMLDLHGHADIVILDGAPGFGKEALAPMEIADEIIVVTTPDHGSIEDAKKSLEVAKEIGKQVIGVVVNMADLDKHEHEWHEIEDQLDAPVIAIIPYDDKVKLSWRLKHPVVHSHPKARASKEFYRLASAFIGPRYSEELRRKEKKGLSGYVYNKLGI